MQLQKNLSAHENFKQKIIDVKDGDTHLTLKELAPVSLDKKINFYQEIQELYKENPTKEELIGLLGRARAKKGIFEGDLDNGELEIGQIAGIINNISSAKDILEEIVTDFETSKKNIFKIHNSISDYSILCE